MRGRILAACGCLAAIGVFFPAWDELSKWEAEGKSKHGIYTQVRDLDSQIKTAQERSKAAEEKEAEYAEKIKPYEEMLGRASDVRGQKGGELGWKLSSEDQVFLKTPYMLDVDGLIKSYEATKGSVGFTTAVSSFGGVIGDFFSSITNDVTADFAEDEATARLELAADLYQMVEGISQEAEAALLDYWSLAGYADSLFQTEDEGVLLEAVMTAEQMGGWTEEELVRLDETKGRAVDALAKLDFCLNVYYDLSRDSMIESDVNQSLLDRVSQTRNQVSALLEGEDLSTCGYTREEKWGIVKPLLEKWSSLIYKCYQNGSEEYANGQAIIQLDSDWTDLWFQDRSDGQRLPKVLAPHWGDRKYGNPVYVLYSNDVDSRHRAYYMRKDNQDIWYYETDRGEELMEGEAGDEKSEENLSDADQVWELAAKGENNWEMYAASYLE